MSQLAGNIKVGARIVVNVPILTQQGDAVTKQYTSGPVTGRYWVESCTLKVDIKSTSAGAATCTTQAVKTSDQSTYTAMGAAAAPTLTANSQSTIDVYTVGDSGTEYDIGGNRTIDSRQIVENGQAIGLQIVTSGGSGQNPIGVATFVLQELATTSP